MFLTRTLIRRAKKADIPFIMDILSANEMLIPGLDWNEIDNTWWVGVHHNGDIIGCIQVLFGKPLSLVTFLAVDPKYHNSGLGVQLIKTADVLLGLYGSDAYIAMTDNKKLLARTEDLGYTTLGDITVNIKRVFQYEKAKVDTHKNDYRH